VTFRRETLAAARRPPALPTFVSLADAKGHRKQAHGSCARVWFLASARMTALGKGHLASARMTALGKGHLASARMTLKRPRGVRVRLDPDLRRDDEANSAQIVFVSLADARAHLRPAHESCAFGSSRPHIAVRGKSRARRVQTVIRWRAGVFC